MGPHKNKVKSIKSNAPKSHGRPIGCCMEGEEKKENSFKESWEVTKLHEER